MFIGILLIIGGIWLTRNGNQILNQQKRDWIASLENERNMIDNALIQIDIQRRHSVEGLEVMSDRISRNEQSERDREESVLRDFKRMLYIH